MKKVLVLANFDVGLYKFRKELLQELMNQGAKVYISLPYGTLVEPLKEMGCKFVETNVDRRGMNPLKDYKLIIEYLKMIRKIRPDMVITYTIKPNLYGGMVCRMLRVPYAMNITGLGTAFQSENMVRKIACFLYRIVGKKAKVVFFENEGNRQVFLKEKLVREKQTCRLNGAGVNIDEYAYVEYPDEKEAIRFLFIGRVMQEKGVDELFTAARKIKEEYPDITVDIIGPFEDNYEEKIHQLTEEKVIEYHGYQEDVKPFIERSHCFVLPSWHEGMANTNLECASMGRPVITSKIHGCMEAVIENESGLLCEKQNAEDLYRQMQKFIELPYEDKKAMGQAGRKHMEKVFDKKKVVRKTILELMK